MRHFSSARRAAVRPARHRQTGRRPKNVFLLVRGGLLHRPGIREPVARREGKPQHVELGGSRLSRATAIQIPSHKYRRLHLNLPGAPEGSAFSAETVMDSVERSVSVRLPQPKVVYFAFTDMSGGSSDDATLAITRRDIDRRVWSDRVLDQGQRPPFDPPRARRAVCGRAQRIRLAVGGW